MRIKRPILLLSCLFLFFICQAQVSKTINVITPGTLSTLLTSTELSTVTNLTVTGNIDARDFKTMRDKMQLTKLDISKVIIQTYTGNDGSNFDNSVVTVYPINEIPKNALGDLYYCLKTIVLPNSITSIGDYAFYGDSMLSGSLIFPSSITNIGIGAFNNCSGLTGSLIFPSTVNRIGQDAFTNCSGLTGSLTIPSSVTTIEFDAFEGCSGLKGTLNIPSSVTTIASFAFRYCSGFTGTLNIPSTVTTLGVSAFEGCSGFTGTLNIPASITKIGDNTFANCSGLTGQLILPSGLTNIGSSTFNNCKGFTGTLTIPSTVTSIGELSFANCSGFTGSLSLPSGISTIDYGTFWGCSGLSETLVIPASVSTLVSNAFNGCINLKRIYAYRTYPQNGMNTDTYTFPGVPTSTCFLYVPIGQKTNYSTTPVWQDFKNIVEGVPATVSTQEVSNVNSSSPSGNGIITNLDTNNPTQYGVVWSTLPNPTVELSSKNVQGSAITTGPFSSVLKGLAPSTLYYVKAFTTNSIGTSYGEQVTFTSNNFIGLTISNPIVVTNKMVDGNTNAVITKLGTLEGVNVTDIGNVTVAATANYNNANVETNKTITVVYTLSGSAKDKYSTPVDYIVSNAKISGYITLNPVSTPSPGCDGSDMDITYSLKTGTPTNYKITFNNQALNAGMKNIDYTALSSTDTNGVITISLPEGVYGTYTGTLKMNNELNVESSDYPFSFTINVSADNIRTKFNTLVMFDNSSNRFTGYQWYKNNLEIAGATKQFYVDPSGLVGSYSLKLTTTDGTTLYSCPKVLNIPSGKAKVNAYPNPVKENESCTVQITGLTDDELTDTKLSVYNIQGICVYESSIVNNTTQFNLSHTGIYIGHVTTSGIDHVFKIIVSK